MMISMMTFIMMMWKLLIVAICNEAAKWHCVGVEAKQSDTTINVMNCHAKGHDRKASNQCVAAAVSAM